MVNIDRVRELLVDEDGRLRLFLSESRAVPVGPAYRDQVEDVLGIAR